MDDGELHERVLGWYAASARDLPWRRPEATPWGVLVSEIMLQQTPVARVLPVWEAWMAAWPAPADLVEAGAGEAVRAWGRLGYPRRALRLHAAARPSSSGTAARCPARYADAARPARRRRLHRGRGGLLRVRPAARGPRHQRAKGPGPGGRRARVPRHVGDPRGAGPRGVADARGTRDRGHLGGRGDGAGRARVHRGPAPVRGVPGRGPLPVADRRLPRVRRPAAPRPSYAGTDRQCRGRLLEVLRDDHGPVHRSRLDAVWHDALQRDRCLEGLLADGLAVQLADDVYALP